METILEIQEYVNDPPLDDDGMMFHDVIFANLVNCFEENCFQPMSMYTEKLDAEALSDALDLAATWAAGACMRVKGGDGQRGRACV